MPEENSEAEIIEPIRLELYAAYQWGLIIKHLSRSLVDVESSIDKLSDYLDLDSEEFNNELGYWISSYSALAVSNAAAQITNVIAQIGKSADYLVPLVETLSLYAEALSDAMHFNIMVEIVDISFLQEKSITDGIFGAEERLTGIDWMFGWPEGCMSYFLNDARQQVLDFATLSGKSYEMSLLEWFYALMDFSKFLAKKEVQYGIHFSVFRLWIIEYFDKKYYTAKASMHLDQMALIKGVIKGFEIILGDSESNLETRMDRIVGYIQDLRREVYLKNIYFETKINLLEDDTYRMFREVVLPAFQELHKQADKINNRMYVLENMLFRPGDFLKRIDKLPDEDRLEQESVIAEIATRAYNTVTEEINKDIDDELKVAEADFDKIISA